jgi:hypothetical protein
MADLTIIYSTAHKIDDDFRMNVVKRLYECAGHPIVEIHSSPKRASIHNYYKELLTVAQDIKTPYIAIAEDDTLYSDEHFTYRPPMDTFAYNYSRWNLFTWSQPPFYSLGFRMILASMIAPRELFIDWLEERFRVDPDGEKLEWWGEPGRFQHERGLKVSHRKAETFHTYSPIVVFSHPGSYGYEFRGTNKRANKIRAFEIPYHGHASAIIKLYKENKDEKVRPQHSDTREA